MTIYSLPSGRYQLERPGYLSWILSQDELERLMRACLDAQDNFGVTSAITADEPAPVEA